MSNKKDLTCCSKKRMILFAVCFLLTVLWMVVIFGFSSETSDRSTERSDPASTHIAKAINPEYKESEKMGEFAELYVDVSHFVRKSAHIIAYALLGVLTYLTAGSLRRIPGKPFGAALVSVPFCLVYAMLDEYHQTFVDGRAGRVSDVFIDGIGVIFGTAAVMLIVHAVFGSRKKSDNK